VEIWRKNRVEVEQKIQVLIKKLQDENEEFKGSISWLKSQDEELQNLRQKATIWETIERKWTEALFIHKKQQEVLDSQLKALIKEKKEENVLTNLELVNMKNVFLLQSKELKRKVNKSKKNKVTRGKERVLVKSTTPTNIVRNGTGIEEEFGSSWCQEKIKRL
jgi:hypothetical protein